MSLHRWLMAVLTLSACVHESEPERIDELASCTGPTAIAEVHAAANSGDACAEQGRASLQVIAAGLPCDVSPEIYIEGAENLLVDNSGKLFDVAAGSYMLRAPRVFDRHWIVRTALDSRATDPFCLAPSEVRSKRVEYVPVRSSGKLWISEEAGGKLTGFAAEVLDASGIIPASAALATVAGNALAFDRNGNLWTNHEDHSSVRLTRFPAMVLGDRGTASPDIVLEIVGFVPKCAPTLHSLAFDSRGNLWASACSGEIFRMRAEDLVASSAVQADVRRSVLPDNSDLAFDSLGNLWAAQHTRLVRYDASRLEVNSEGPDFSLEIVNPQDGGLFSVGALAFDEAGRLWGLDVNTGTVFRIGTTDLDDNGTKRIEPQASLVVRSVGKLRGLAFDEGASLWTVLSGGRVGRLNATLLEMGSLTAVEPDVILETGDFASGAALAFFPAPKGLPLYHSLPRRSGKE